MFEVVKLFAEKQYTLGYSRIPARIDLSDDEIQTYIKNELLPPLQADGIIFGAIPGLSATTAIVLCLPLTYKMTDIQGMALLVSLFIGGISGGLISAIYHRRTHKDCA